MFDLTYTIDVGYTTQYPLIPDQFTSRVTVLADTDAQAIDIAACMVACKPQVAMPTSTTIVDVCA